LGTITVAKNVGSDSKFFGFTSDSLLSTLTITPFGDSSVGIDDVTYGGVSPVSVPAAVWLFGTALIGLVGFGKRRKAAWH
jgi:hypothetical protein